MGRKVRCDALSLGAVQTGRGIVIGLCAPKQDTALLLVPTPATAPGVAESSWATLHAQGLSRMLLGGVVILGTYDFGRDSTVATEPRDIVAAAALAADVTTRPASTEEHEHDPIVLVRAQGGRVVAKTVAVNRAAETRPAEFKAVEGLSKQLRILRAVVPVSAAALAHVPHGSDAESNEMQLKAECMTLNATSDTFSRIVLQISAETYVVDEQDRRSLGSVSKFEGSSLEERFVINANVLIPVGDNFVSCFEPAKETGLSRIIRLGGSVGVCAIVASDASLGEALAAVRADLSQTLAVRAELLKELDEEGSNSPTNISRFAARSLPARVLVLPRQVPGLPFCDYIVQDETLEDDVAPRLAEMLSWSSDIQQSYKFSLVERLRNLPCSVDAKISPNGNATASVAAGTKRDPVSHSPSVKHRGVFTPACGLATAVLVAAAGIACQLIYLSKSQ